VLRLVLAAALALPLAACGGPDLQADVEGLRLLREGGGYPTLTGYVVNRGETPITSADVFVTLYDADHQVLEDVMVPVRNVAAGDSARFEQQLDLPAGSAKLKYVGAN
jgi:hypothetical protein